MTRTPADLRTIGFFASRPATRPDWISAATVEIVCTASGCTSEWPDGWITHGKHSELWLYNSPADAESVVASTERAAFRIFAVRTLPVLFAKEGQQPLDVAQAHPHPIPSSFVRLGYDIVAWHGYGWECSPLSCNGLAAEHDANRFCLFDDFDRACRAAEQFARSDGIDAEPGPYAVHEVWSEPFEAPRP